MAIVNDSPARISQQEQTGVEEGRLTYLWLIVDDSPIHALWALYVGHASDGPNPTLRCSPENMVSDRV